MSIDGTALTKRVGRNCAEARRGAGLSQLQLGLRLYIHPNDISRLENGRNCPRLVTLVRLARVLEVPLADLLEGIE
ncbi:MAG TPA: helix-turn-helix transcriptional regulator [Solirubrobacterales bacterium]|nr:helix-turn-helix transcriptional regulator [Solirubrobacterales bacterium]